MPEPPQTPPSVAASPAPFDPRRLSHWLVHIGSPLGISLLLHAALLGIFATITWVVVQRGGGADDAEFEASIIAEGPVDNQPGGFQFPGQAMLDRPDSARSGAAAPAGETLATLLKKEDTRIVPDAVGSGSLAEGIGAGALSGADIIGVGGGGGALGGAGLGNGLGDRDTAGGGPVGSLWGVGQGQRARTVVYVVDRSGSFVEWVDAIDMELKRSLGVLREDQLFDVIFLRENKPLTFKPRLIPADEAGKREAFEWINGHPPAGGSDLVPAVREALRFAPQVMFIVTDQEFLRSVDRSTDMPQLLSLIRSSRRQHRTTINVILMGAADRPAGDAALLRERLERERSAMKPEEAARIREQLDLLETIEAVEKLPQETGGSFSYLNGDELMDRWRAGRARP